MKRFQVEWDEWTGIVWFRRTTDALDAYTSERYYKMLLEEPILRIRNIAIRDAAVSA